MDGIRLDHICKTYHVKEREIPVFKGLCLSVPERRITVVLGRSGCGKTTLLRLAGGLEKPDSGKILRAGKQKMAFVFQEPRLIPWLTVWDNVAFGVKRREMEPERIREIIRTVGLSGFEKAVPAQLSGGMQQRAAIARALAYAPTFILMDEPFASLDDVTRGQMQKELLRVQRERESSILFVTHSMDEALLLGDRIVIIEGGLVKAEYQVPEPEGGRDLSDGAMISLKREIMMSMGSIPDAEGTHELRNC